MNTEIDLIVLVFCAVLLIALVGLVLSAIGWCVEKVQRAAERRHIARLYAAHGDHPLVIPPQTEQEWRDVLTQVARDARRWRRDRQEPQE